MLLNIVPNYMLVAYNKMKILSITFEAILSSVLGLLCYKQGICALSGVRCEFSTRRCYHERRLQQRI